MNLTSKESPQKERFFLKILFFPCSPQSPPVHSCIFFVVGPSSCSMWDAASAWFDEQCHVHVQDYEPTKHWAACRGARELNHSATGPAPLKRNFWKVCFGEKEHKHRKSLRSQICSRMWQGKIGLHVDKTKHTLTVKTVSNNNDEL